MVPQLALAQLRYAVGGLDFLGAGWVLDPACPIDAAALVLAVNEQVRGSTAIAVLQPHCDVFGVDTLQAAYRSLGLDRYVELVGQLCRPPQSEGLDDPELELQLRYRDLPDADLLERVAGTLTEALDDASHQARFDALVDGVVSANTLLIQAIDHEDLPRMKELLALGADPNFQDGRSTPLSYAVYMVKSHFGDMGLVSAVLEAGARPEVADNWEALYDAVPDTELYGMLLDHGWDPSGSAQGIQALTHMLRYMLEPAKIATASEAGRESDEGARACFALTMTAGLDLSVMQADRGTLLTLWTAPTDVLVPLLDAGAPFESLDEAGLGPLSGIHWRAGKGDLLGVQLLLDRGANPNARLCMPDYVPRMGAFAMRYGTTPLDVAELAGHADVVAFLRASGGVRSAPSWPAVWLDGVRNVDESTLPGRSAEPLENRIAEFLTGVVDDAEGVYELCSTRPLRRAIAANERILIAEARNLAAAQRLVRLLSENGLRTSIELADIAKPGASV